MPLENLPPHPHRKTGEKMIAEIALIATLSINPSQIIEQAATTPPAQQPFRDCVAKRESNGNYLARNRTSSAAGKYQFLDYSWRQGLAHMVSKRLTDYGMPPAITTRIRTELRKNNIAKWHPQYQEIAFVAVLNADGPWSGWRHWYYNNSPCNRLVK